MSLAETTLDRKTGYRWTHIIHDNDESFVVAELQSILSRLRRSEPEFEYSFKNDVFELHRSWQECSCGHTLLAHNHDQVNPHATNCQELLCSAQFDRFDSGEELCELDAAIKRWAKSMGLKVNNQGVYWYCTCHAGSLRDEFDRKNTHLPTCREIVPEFRCGNIEIRWYKRLGRSMEVNREVTYEEWEEMFDKCRASLKKKE